MAAIITDQLRILNAKNFVAGVQSSQNSYYAFIGLPNPENYQSDWDTSPPAPKDSLDQSNDYWDTMLALKKIQNLLQKISSRRFTTSLPFIIENQEKSSLCRRKSGTH